MAAASPTPLPTSYGHDRLFRQPSSRQLYRSQPSRPTLRRNSPLSVFRNSNGFGAGAEGLQSISVGDSSDDEAFPVLKLSAASRAILGDGASSVDPSSLGDGYKETAEKSDRGGHYSRGSTPSGAKHLRIYRQSSPSVLGHDKVSPPRVVQIRTGGQGSTTLRRNLSMVGRYPEANFSKEGTPHELITPAPGPRRVPPLRSAAGSAASVNGFISRPGSAGHGSAQGPGDGNDIALPLRDRLGSAEAAAVQQDLHAAARARSGDDSAVQNSIRVKRVPMGTGTFLRGKPMRRPLRKQNSNDALSPNDSEARAPTPVVNSQIEDEPRPASRSGSVGIKSAHVSVQDFAERPKFSFEQERYPHPTKENPPPEQEKARLPEPRPPSRYEQRPPSPKVLPKGQPAHLKGPAEPLVFKVPQLPPVLPSLYDQENEPPPTFKKNKPQISILQDKENKMLVDTPVPAAASPNRPALAARSQNTPHRPAPPPPKMSIVEAATAKAGASTAKGKKKRSHVTVNGQLYTLMDLLGRGGSSKVYQVLAPNNKRYALKRVNLEGIDEHAVMGYKGEIELLRKLEKCERVVKLIDWEVSEEKMSLSVIMEIGDSDLNLILSPRLHGTADAPPKLDLPFVRHMWKEMLECVDAVHAFDIVHSDLKPANFLLVKGRLKLIDFGIANAIDVEHTVNVHRESNVGTPNYMSPESITDLNNDGAKGPHKVSGQGSKAPRLMKLGKPSDVWSLGCILYQMVYGKPPFAYIANQLQRIMAITNPDVEISYPDTGIGGAYVPLALKRTLKQCLTRDPTKRPTAAQLLHERNAWLYPEAAERGPGEGGIGGAVMVDEELLGRILMNVVERCRDPKRGCPTDEEVRGYPGQFLAKIRGMMEDVGWDR